MGRKIYKDITNKDFHNILANTNEFNKTILTNLYTAVSSFISLSQQPTFDSTLIDLLKKYEAEAYVTKNGPLTDKEIIKLELKRIREEYLRQIQQNENNVSTIANLSDDISTETEASHLILVEYYLDQLKIFKEIPPSALTQENITFIKMRIAYIEALLKMKNGLYYETYLNFEEEFERVRNQNNDDHNAGIAINR